MGFFTRKLATNLARGNDYITFSRFDILVDSQNLEKSLVEETYFDLDKKIKDSILDFKNDFHYWIATGSFLTHWMYRLFYVYAKNSLFIEQLTNLINSHIETSYDANDLFNKSFVWIKNNIDLSKMPNKPHAEFTFHKKTKYQIVWSYDIPIIDSAIYEFFLFLCVFKYFFNLYPNSYKLFRITFPGRIDAENGRKLSENLFNVERGMVIADRIVNDTSDYLMKEAN